ncbi:MAG: hypothetical protein IBJ12_15155 [Sphingomonadaceae bacterium]|nr:hypothetical protein [Sphingomonadaceae bacterium]
MKHFTLFWAVLALAARVLVPAGFMPASDRAFALTVCTGVDTQTIWMDRKGGLHKENPQKHEQRDHKPCAFAGGGDVASIAFTAADRAEMVSPTILSPKISVPAIGQGLAAPPPPQTGPPVLI